MSITTSHRAVGPNTSTNTDDHDGESVEDRLAAAQEASPAEREEILSEVIVSQLPLARSIAARYRDRGESLDDLVQVASMALVMATQRYRPGQGVSFSAFAVPTITGELRRYFRDHGWAIRPPRRIQELRPRLRAATEELTQERHRPPSAAELAEHLDVPVDDVLETQAATGSYHHLSLDTPTHADEGAAPLADSVGAADERLDRVLERVSVRPLLSAISSRDRKVLALRYFDDCTQQQIADQIGVTQMQVSRLLSQSLSTLRALADRD